MPIIKRFFLLAAFWLLLSGHYDPLMLGFGAFSLGLVFYISIRMDRLDGEVEYITFGQRVVRYWFWLVGQIFVSSIGVTKLVWGKTSDLSPSLEKVPATTVPDSTQVLYANSITLTPGTLSVDIEDGDITVHALQKKSLQELKEGAMAKKISEIWKKER